MSDDTEALTRIYAEMDARTHLLDSLVCAALSAERPVFSARDLLDAWEVDGAHWPGTRKQAWPYIQKHLRGCVERGELRKTLVICNHTHRWAHNIYSAGEKLR